MNLGEGGSPKDLLADTLVKAAIILNNPNKPFGDLGKQIGELATKEIIKIEKEMKVIIASF